MLTELAHKIELIEAEAMGRILAMADLRKQMGLEDDGHRPGKAPVDPPPAAPPPHSPGERKIPEPSRNGVHKPSPSTKSAS